MRIGSEAPKRRTHSSIRLEAKGRLGIPPPRTVIGVPSRADKAETVGVPSASSTGGRVADVPECMPLLARIDNQVPGVANHHGILWETIGGGWLVPCECSTHGSASLIGNPSGRKMKFLARMTWARSFCVHVSTDVAMNSAWVGRSNPTRARPATKPRSRALRHAI
jgi:hypothetical protein